jgi:anti-sigma28 factor (negative regulator of flagellin synthesis)
MKIKDSTQLGQLGSRSFVGGRTDRAEDRKGRPADADTVNVRSARLLGDRIDSDQIKAERAARVAELKALVQSGNYKPDPRAVAAKVAAGLDEEVGLLRAVVGDE